MPGLSSWGVFLSYRREDATPYARLLQFQLRERFPDTRVFMRLDSIEPGLDFAEVIREEVGSCAVLVVLIGRQWATLTDTEGRRRLDDPDDYVRFEVQSALERGVRVIPVLVDGAGPLRQQHLPSELQRLARLNALELSYGRYEYDAARLLDLIQLALTAAPAGNVPGRASKAVCSDQGRAARLIADAERTAWSITDESIVTPWRALALIEVAKALAAIDPDRATQLIADAERTAQFITDEYFRARALAQVATALAATDPDRATQLIADAERTAQDITDESSKGWKLVAVAKALAAIDPDRATQLIADAERTAQDITQLSVVEVLTEAAKALAAIDPDRAERTALAITNKFWRVKALVAIAEA